MNAKISVFVICVEVIIYLLLYNLHDCSFKICYAIFKEMAKILKVRGFTVQAFSAHG